MATQRPWLAPAQRRRLSAGVPAAPRFMPGCGSVRRLYARHVFVARRAAARCFDVRFIDPEKTPGWHARSRELARRLAVKRP